MSVDQHNQNKLADRDDNPSSNIGWLTKINDSIERETKYERKHHIANFIFGFASVAYLVYLIIKLSFQISFSYFSLIFPVTIAVAVILSFIYSQKAKAEQILRKQINSEIK
ncbi:MAG TPA: hypothetical protein PLI45_04690 [Candidatus Woesebacteria bacterium]|nr:hypothetical protein [Candidatus Woesebacteria bacterium]